MSLDEFVNRIYDLRALSHRFRQVDVSLSKINFLYIQAYFKVPVNEFTTIPDISKKIGIGESTIYKYIDTWRKHHMIEIERIRNGNRRVKAIRRRFKILVILDDKTIQFLE